MPLAPTSRGDLNAHNILLAHAARWLLDFDRGSMRTPARSLATGDLGALAPFAGQARRRARRRATLRRHILGPLMAAYERALGGFAAQATAGGDPRMTLALHFLGVGSAQAVELGSCSVPCSSATTRATADRLRPGDADALLSTCAPNSAACGDLTHTHMGSCRRSRTVVLSRAYFDAALRGSVKLYTHAALLPYLQARIAIATIRTSSPRAARTSGTPSTCVPCSRGFWHEGLWFERFPTRHHAPMTSVRLGPCSGRFAWTGDTRPDAGATRAACWQRRDHRARLRAHGQSVAQRRR